MQKIFTDYKQRFAFAFDDETGAYARTGIIDEHGADTGVDPFMGSFPQLIDVGIMGHCEHGKRGLCLKAGIGCYQSGPTTEQPNMTVEDFRWIAEQCEGKVLQFALGGRGDPDQHQDFERILHISREHGIVPNFTTSGLGMTPDIASLCKKHCGAVAVSWYRSAHTLAAIDMLLQANVRTNIHYVLGKNSIDEAIERLRSNDFPSGINAVVFLLHKPVGLGTRENMLDMSDPRLANFFAEFERPHPFKVGLDSCTVPGVLSFCSGIALESLDTCEAGRFSCYIGPDLLITPCSFDQANRFTVQLRPTTIQEAWDGEVFEQFRSRMRNACPSCPKRDLCLGGCPLAPEIVLCGSLAKQVKERPKKQFNTLSDRRWN